MSLIFSHPTGNQFSRALAIALEKDGILDSYYTSIATYPTNIFGLLSHFPGLNELRRRSFDPILQSKTISHSYKEVLRILATKFGFDKLTAHEEGIFSVDKVYEYLDFKISRAIIKGSHSDVNALYTYEDCAINSFRAAKIKNIKCFYDLPIGYWKAARDILSVELEKWPDWASTMPTFIDSQAKLKRKDIELELADHIFVASSFTRKTLDLYPHSLAPVSVIPYGFPPVNCEERLFFSKKCGPLKLLFVGGLSQRKGIANLFSALSKFSNSVTLTVIGNRPSINCIALDKELSKHNYIPTLPHDEILQMMRNHDVLVFPSLFEGFGLVISESMSQGTPVITTDRTCGGDFITHGQNGWLVEAGSTQALISQIEQILDNPESIERLGRAALETAKLRTWEHYGEELISKIKVII
jgi:glycosyltransferase involved in cell wall biosynthesis